MLKTSLEEDTDVVVGIFSIVHWGSEMVAEEAAVAVVVGGSAWLVVQAEWVVGVIVLLLKVAAVVVGVTGLIVYKKKYNMNNIGKNIRETGMKNSSSLTYLDWSNDFNDR